MKLAQPITPCLWFDNQAERAANFYVGIFPDSGIGKTSRYTEAGREHHRQEPGTVLTIEFQLAGQPFTALNGGPLFKFTEAISFQVMCETQAEVDYFWEKLGAGGEPKAAQCGWLKDRFGVSWQIVPTVLAKLLTSADREKANRAMTAMMAMKKLDIAALQRAYDGA